jgi:transcriptional regulator of arginine metabolism
MAHMAGKDVRQAAILELAQAGQTRTQTELLEALRVRRIKVDQSTLSRDLAELNVRKSGGRYRLLPNGVGGNGSADGNGGLDYSAAVRRFTTCGPHMIVVNTGVGQAQPVSLEIERAGEPSITATLAGDDTIFIATKNRRSQVVALRRLTQWFGEKYEQ